MSTLRPLLNLFGRPYDDDEVIRSLAALPPHKAQRPSDGSQYVVSKAGGFELLFEDPNTRGAGHRQHRTLAAVFLFNAGVDGYSRYAGAIPFGFSLDDTRSALIARHPPDLTWSIGAGRVPVDHPDPSHDQWRIDGLAISVDYDDDHEAIRRITFALPTQIPDIEPEWTPPDTWETLALLPGRKLEAIQLYREEHGGSMADAKAAVERLAASRT